ncbi:MAG TPA: rod shape-determining protein RodA [Nitrospiraceae bacterium]|jgi:rod shape determining protein RodA|nr:rod shape-determining protein RodA [Nitrospiraceae bacterium]
MIDRVIDNRGFDSFDWRFIGLVLAILSLGVLSIYSVTHAQQGGTPFYLKQLMWIALGSAAFVAMLIVDYHKIARLAYPLYAIVLVLLAVVLVMGKTSRGAQRWIPIGPFAFQPSEFAKLVLILVLAHYYSSAPRIGWLQRVVLPGLIMLPGLLLILKQPDLGSGLSFLAVYAAMLLMVGMRSQAIGIILLFSLMLFPFVWELLWGSLHEYQRHRIMAFVDPEYDPGGKGYHALQSRIAIGSGELLGKGLYGGTQSQLKFLPEGHTDFVFAVFAEEWGFLGVLLLLALFVGLIWLSLEIASRAKDILGALLAAGVIAMLCFCVVVNIGMTAGMFPIVGIPLPLMSYGGSATIATMAALGLLLNIKRRRLTLFY